MSFDQDNLDYQIPKWRMVVYGLVTLFALMEVFCLFLCMNFISKRTQMRVNYRSAEDYISAARVARTMQSKHVKLIYPVLSRPTHDLKDSILFHPVLGWDYPPNLVYQDYENVQYTHGSLGERITCTSFPKTLISTYGDSCVHCEEVGDQETWQTRLAEMIHANVLNFGVGGYGPDQAYLRYLERGTKAPTPIVILGLLPEDINRVVNVFRSFYNFDDPLGLTKPRFLCRGTEKVLLSNPITSRDELLKLEDPDFIRHIGENDYWYQLGRKRPPIHFPYTYSAVQWRQVIGEKLRESISRQMPSFMAPVFGENLYDETEPLATICEILDRFVRTAGERAEVPVIVFMAHAVFIKEFLEYGTTRYEPLLKYLRARGYSFVDLNTEIARTNPSQIQLDSFSGNHARPEGNKMVANLLAYYLAQNGLIKKN